VLSAGLLLVLLVDVLVPERALDNETLLRKAETHFHNGLEHGDGTAQAKTEFLRAAEFYEELRLRGAANGSLYRNLGHAWLLGGDLPHAILAYRHGLQVSPSDRDLREALSYARSQVAYPTAEAWGRPPSQERPPWLPRLPSAWYLCLAIAVHAIASLATARWWMTSRRCWLGIASIAFAIAALLAVVLVAEEMRDDDFRVRPIVVIADDGVLLRSGNGVEYPPRVEAPLNRGVEARLLFVRADWMQIELARGQIGWVPAEKVASFPAKSTSK